MSENKINSATAQDSNSNFESPDSVLSGLSLNSVGDEKIRFRFSQAIAYAESEQWIKSLNILRTILHVIDDSSDSASTKDLLYNLLSMVLYQKGLMQFDRLPDKNFVPAILNQIRQKLTNNQARNNKTLTCFTCNNVLTRGKTAVEIDNNTFLICINCSGLLTYEESEHDSHLRFALTDAARDFAAAAYYGSIEAAKKLSILEKRSKELALTLPDQEQSKLDLDLSGISELTSILEQNDESNQLDAINALRNRGRYTDEVMSALMPLLLNTKQAIRLATTEALNTLNSDWFSLPQTRIIIPDLEQAYLGRNRELRAEAHALLLALQPELIPRLKRQRIKRNLQSISIIFLLLVLGAVIVQIGMYFRNDPVTVHRFLNAGIVSAEQILPRLTAAVNHPDTNTSETAAKMLKKLAINWDQPKIPPENLKDIIRALNSNSATTRNYITKSLEHFGPLAENSLPALLARIRHENDSLVRDSMARTIGAIGAASSTLVPDLIKIVRHPNCPARKTAITAIGYLGEQAREAVPVLIESLKYQDCSNNQSVKKMIGSVATQLATKKTISVLGSSTLQTSARIQEAAAIALGKIGANTENAILALVRVADSQDFQLRKISLTTLGKLGKKANLAIPYLLVYLENKDVEIRLLAKRTLKRIDPNWEDADSSWRSMSSTVTALQTYEQGLKHENHLTQEHYAKALMHMGPTGIPIILKIFESDDVFTKIAVLRALSQSEERSLNLIPVTALIGILNSQNREVRIKTVILLGELGDKASQAVPQLIALLERDNYTQVREQVVVTLGEIGPNAAPAGANLKALLYDPDWNNRQIVVVALKKIVPQLSEQ